MSDKLDSTIPRLCLWDSIDRQISRYITGAASPRPRFVSPLSSGLIFALGLGTSGMTNPMKVGADEATAVPVRSPCYHLHFLASNIRLFSPDLCGIVPPTCLGYLAFMAVSSSKANSVDGFRDCTWLGHIVAEVATGVCFQMGRMIRFPSTASIVHGCWSNWVWIQYLLVE